LDIKGGNLQAFDHISIEVLNLSKRTYHALARSGVLTIGNLRQLYLKDSINYIPLIGEKSLSEVSKALEELHKNPVLLALAEKELVQLDFHEEIGVEPTNQSSIDVLKLPRAIRWRLKKHGIKTIADLRKTPDTTLSSINQIGPKTLIEIRQRLNEVVDTPPSVVPVVNEPVTTVEKRIITWSQVVEDYFRNEKDVYSYILISRFG
jgi:DNA-directed RNA polymerase alpha subunit